MPKTRVTVRSMGSGKCEVSVGATNGLAVYDGNGWMLSPNLRNLPEAAEAALLKRLEEFRPAPTPDRS